MAQPQLYLVYGGGLGDVIFDYLNDPAAMKIESLVKDYDARVRIWTQCHNSGVEDVWRHHPFVHEHLMEPWQPPSPENTHRFQEPIDGWFPIRRDDMMAALGTVVGVISQPKLYLSEAERSRLGSLVSQRPCVVLQPYAGLSDRDGFNPATLHALVMALARLEPQVRVLVVGKNHERNHKYTRETVGFSHPNMVDLIDQAGIRLCYHLVAKCDAFCGAHSNLIRTAWDFRRRNVCVLPDPLMTAHLPNLDAKYTYGWKFPESKIFTYPFEAGGQRQFSALDTASVARWLLGRE